MSKSTNSKKFQVPDGTKEPGASYGKEQERLDGIPTVEKTVHFFSSFDEQEEYHRKQMAMLTHEELLNNLAQMRKLFFRDYLLPDGNWKPMKFIIRINTPHY